MVEPQRSDEAVVEELLETLRGDEPEAPADLPAKTIRKVQAAMTTRDLIDLTTVVFVLRFCAPFLDLIAAFFGRSISRDPDDRRGQ